MLQRFGDPAGGGLFMAEASEAGLAMVRPKDVADGPIPAGNAVALDVLVKLALRTGERAYSASAESLVGAFAAEVERKPAAYPMLLIGIERLRHGETGERQYAGGGVVRAEARASRSAGRQAALTVDLQLKPGWHVNAERPLQDYLVPTSVRLAGDGRGWRIDRTIFPAPRTVRLGFQPESLALYEGAVRIAADLQQTDGQGGALPWLALEVRLQACSDQVCLAPETLRLNVPVASSALRE
jgi:DsbC/DsbD-like thiol-disulfide interchange protein